MRIDISAHKAGAADGALLTEFAAACVAEQAPRRGGEMWAARHFRQAPYAFDELASADALAMVGTLDDVGLGYGVAVLERLPNGDPIAVVTDLFVLAEARGVGIGEAIMDALVAWANEHECIGIDAQALPGDRNTKNFFETFGLVARQLLVHRDLRN